MGKNITFTEEQRYVIDKISKEGWITSRFYFTGGTALSYLYLHHRYSEDLDFFSEKEFDKDNLLSLIQEWANDKRFTFTAQWKEVVYIFIFTFANGESLKLDFGYYPHTRVEKGIKYEDINVDSKFDIAINKLVTVSQRSAVKDYVDLYFLLKEYSLWDLLQGVQVKFNMKLDPFLLAGDLLRVEEFTTLPRMIQPLTLEELKKFYIEKVRDLGMTAVE